MRESNYWLRLIEAIEPVDDDLKSLLNESTQLKNILGSISSKVSIKL